MKLECWKETVASSLEEHGVAATQDQITAIADDVAGAHEVYGEYHYQPRGEDLLKSETDRLKAELRKERDKVQCKTCNGTGEIVQLGPTFGGYSQCWKCDGHGRHDP